MMNPPPEARSMILMTGRSSGEQPPPPGISPPRLLPDEANPPGAPGPQGVPPPGARGGPGLLPDFPQRVVRTADPETFWLLIHLPMNQLRIAGLQPAMLVGHTHSVGESPLLFNPDPWLYFIGGMIVFSVLFWLVLTRSLTRVIARMMRATEAIAEGRFDVQAPDRRADELGRLGFAINRMAARLQGFITGQRRFLGDVAHELCSPLARMEIALGILEERGDPRDTPLVRDVREEVTHMRRLAHELLSFSRAAVGGNRLRLDPVPVEEIVAAALRQEQAGNGRVQIQVPAGLRMRAHGELMTRAVANLVRNALRYAGEAGPITVSAWEEDAQVVLSVADAGPGVPPHELERLFDPFYRLDESRGAETGGAGLGLAIVKTCVEACHGTVSAFNRQPHGLDVRIRGAAVRSDEAVPGAPAGTA
jgi:two-component system sensor histidine kinase CpxA